MKALRHGSTFDFLSSALVFLGYSIPGWALVSVLFVVFGGGSFLDWVPLGGFRSDNWEQLPFWGKALDQLHHCIVPMIGWSIASFAIETVLMKNALLENLSADYVRTAFAKGLREKRVVWVHVMRNSLIPIAATIGHIITILLAGSYLIEVASNIDGFGMLGYRSVLERDFTVIMGVLVISVFLRLIGNILSDIALATVDPRIRFQ
jgi:microcin C transport system permease protein